jgi:hypothetical protein
VSARSGRAVPGNHPDTRILVAVVAFSAMLVAACTPVRMSHSHTTSTSAHEPPNITEPAREPVATFGLFAPSSLQGFSPFLSHAFVSALTEVTPPIHARSAHDTVNLLNEQGLAGEYAELMAGFARSRILDRDRMRRIGSALGSRYVFLPGVAELDSFLVDRFEMAGFKLIRNQVTRLRLWLQVWDAQSGRMLWESIGEATVANPVLSAVQATPLDAIAQTLWRRMIQEDLVGKSTRMPSPVRDTDHGAHPRRE